MRTRASAMKMTMNTPTRRPCGLAFAGPDGDLPTPVPSGIPLAASGPLAIPVGDLADGNRHHYRPIRCRWFDIRCFT